MAKFFTPINLLVFPFNVSSKTFKKNLKGFFSFEDFNIFCKARICLIAILIGVSIFSSSSFAQSYQRIGLTGFNHDLVANGSGGPASTSTSIAMDRQGTVMYVQGYQGCVGYLQYGLPQSGTITSAANNSLVYQMAPFNQNNALFLTANQTGVLTFNTSGSYDLISILATSSEGSSSFSATLNFSDGSSSSYSFNVPDWYNGSPFAITNLGRVSRLYCNTDEGTGNPRFYDNNITLNAADKQKLLKSVSFRSNGYGYTSIYAITGRTVSNAPSTPLNPFANNVTSSGFNANWSAVSNATSYRLDVSTDINFNTFLPGYNNVNVGNVTTSSISASAGTYYFRVRAENANGQSLSSSSVSVVVLAPANETTAPTVTAQNVTIQLNSAGTASIVSTSTLSNIFIETFANEPNINVNTLANWTFGGSGQDVDVSDFILNNNSKEIDLAGNSNAKITSKKTFLFAPGQYQITFDNRLNNNPAGGNSVNLSIGNLLNRTFASQLTAVAESATFTVTTPTSAQLVFEQLGTNDAAGSFIGNIKLSRVINPSYSVFVSATDDSGVDKISVSKSTFDCSNLGVNPVTLTVTDVYGNSTVKNVSVTVEDKIAPSIVLNGDATINHPAFTPYVELGAVASDNCSATLVTSGSVNPNLPGIYTLTYLATDGSGNQISKTRSVIVEDKIAPITLTKNITVQLDATGNATITPQQVDNGTTDNSGQFTLGLNQTTFTCNDIGAEQAAEYAIRVDGVNDYIDLGKFNNALVNTSKATAQVWMNPWKITGGTESFFESNDGYNYFSLETNGQGKMSFYVTQSAVVTINPVLNVGQWINLTAVYDGTLAVSERLKIYINGQQVATTLSGTPPANAGNLPAFYLGSQYGTEQFANAIYDEVRVWNKALSAQEIANNWNKTLVGNEAGLIGYYSFEDGPGSSTVTELTGIQSVANLTNMDSNSVWVTGADGLSQGGTGVQVVLTATDQSGNSSQETALVTVEDNLAPTIISKPVSATLTASGTVSITPQDVLQSGTDNCAGTITYSLSRSSFDAQDAINSPLTVQLTGTDANGNSSTVPVQVTVIDPVPVVSTQNITVQLDANGQATITPQQIDNGSSSVVGLSSLTLDKTSFDCSNIGTNTVKLTATSTLGSSASATATVTVEDKIAPTVLVQNKTIQLDAVGNASITVADINNGSTDNCSIASIVLDKTAFDCSNVGDNTVTLTVTDVNGNVSSATTTVLVEDKIAPSVLVQNKTIQLDATGSASITTADINNGSTDNCAIASVVLDRTSFDCSNVGPNTVNLTVTDVNGNLSSASAIVTVEDKIAPIALTQNRTLQLDAAGNASITIADINNGSSDNCSIATIVLDKTAFDCSNVGANTVTLTVTDVNGNVSSATAVVTVEDKIAPTVLTQNISVSLVNGTVSITAADVNNGSFDNCGIASMSVFPSTFVCGQYGNNTVTLTVTDNNGNTSTQTALVNVLGVTPSPAIAVSRTDNTFTGLDNNTIALGYGAQNVVLTASNSTSASNKTSYVWSPAVGLSSTTSANPIFTPTAAGNYTFTVTATNEFGCTATTSVSITVLDVRCGPKNDKVLVCHKTGSAKNPWVQICISENAVAAHLKKGSTLGTCGVSTSSILAFENVSATTLTTLEVNNNVTLNAYPNPFATESTVSFSVPVTEENVSLIIYDVVGTKIATLYSGKAEANETKSFVFNASNYAPGSYFVRLVTSTEVKSFKMIKTQ